MAPSVELAPSADIAADEPVAAAVDADAPAAPAIDAERRSRLDALVAEAETLVAAGGDLRAAEDRLRVLHKDLTLLAGGDNAAATWRERFNAAFVAMKQQRSTERLRKATERQDRSVRQQALVESLTNLAGEAASLESRVLAERFKSLREAIRGSGPLDASFKKAFQNASNAIDERLRAAYEAEGWARFARAGEAESLIAAAESLTTRAQAVANVLPAAQPESGAEAAGGDTTPAEAAAPAGDTPQVLVDAVKHLQQQWKDLGTLPKERRQELWDRFRSACDAVFNALQPWFAARDAARAGNLTAKRALLEELADIVDADPVGLAGSPALRDELGKRQMAVRAIEERWRAAGHVPREAAAEINARWHALLDRHYQERRQVVGQLEAEKSENLKRKEGLLSIAERLAKDAAAAREGRPGALRDEELLRKVKDLQRQWRDIGHVPKADMERINGSFKTHIDTIYQGLEGWFEKQDASRAGNLDAKEKLLVEFEELLSEQRPDWFREQARELRLRWRDLGQVPRDAFERIEIRWRDLNQRFDEACERAQAANESAS
jgi:hypothetical protein